MSLSDEEILKRLGEATEKESSAAIHETVQGASGATFEVLDLGEATWFQMNLARYQSEYLFENVADLQDLDRLLALELLSYRYASWLLRGSDYDDEQFDEKAVREHKQKIDSEIRLVKKHMGMDRKGRVESESQSVSDYLTALLRRAKEFGVHRDNEIAKAIDLFHELEKLMGLMQRTDDEEAKHLGVSPEQVLEWIREVAIPEFRAIDDAFRVNQRLWIKEVS